MVFHLLDSYADLYFEQTSQKDNISTFENSNFYFLKHDEEQRLCSG